LVGGKLGAQTITKRSKKKMQEYNRRETGVEEGPAPFIYEIMSVRFQF
jgi:hypothetical protein